LNAHSSRSHAILCVKVAVTTGDETRISTASAIDLAGSEDNRRTDNGKERMVESASINKSLFVLAQCVEAISKKQARIPYRESKMTRILSLGQNNGFTVMILNLAPVRSYHLDTLSSLNFANRTKKIEVKEIENEPMFKGPPRTVPTVTGPSIQRQPLRPLASMINTHIAASTAKPGDKPDKPVKSFSVYSDRSKPPMSSDQTKRSDIPKRSSPLKRGSDSFTTFGRPAKVMRPGDSYPSQRSRQEIPNVNIEEVVEKKVNEMLAARDSREKASNAQVQRKLELLEQRLEGKDDERAEGLTYMLMAKQHTASGQYLSALKMYRLALPYFPDNDRLVAKISLLEGKIKAQKEGSETVSVPRAVHPVQTSSLAAQPIPQSVPQPEKIQKIPQKAFRVEKDDDYNDQSSPQSDEGYSSDEGFRYKTTKSKKALKRKEFVVLNTSSSTSTTVPSPRTKHLLQIINSRDVSQIKLLKGVGMKRAEAIVDSLCDMDELGDDGGQILSLSQLGKLKGVGVKIVENMRGGIVV
jgi:DNA uptake protein ComE-like DNA-binding protein